MSLGVYKLLYFLKKEEEIDNLSHLGSWEPLLEILRDEVSLMGPQSWLGIKFLDNLYLGRFEVSPSLEIARLPEQTQVTLTGSHELDPGLTSDQAKALQFLGWEKPQESICDCWFKVGSSPESASQLVRQGIECLLFIYAISEGCPVVTSSEHINTQLLKLKESRQVRRPVGIRLQRPLNKRDELR